MYRTRLHFDFGSMHLSIDPLDGAFLELYNHRDCDNLIKNQMNELKKPFVIRIDGEEGYKEFYPVQTTKVIKNMSLAPEIASAETDGGLLVTVKYNYVTEGEEIIPFNVSYTALLHDCTIDFNIHVENSFDKIIREVTFPVVPGIILGDTHEDNTLILPRTCGQKVENAVKALAEPPRFISWRWQEYRSGYALSGFGGKPFGKKGFSEVYPGGSCSMSWVDLYNKDGGLYFACHDENHKKVRLDVGSDGESYPGIVFGTTFMPRLEAGCAYTSPKTVLMLHEGDWHEGAKVYRAFRQPLVKIRPNRFPEWTKKGQALYAHYDFMYQNKRIVHMYKDIPSLVDFAVETNVNHLLFSGWNYDGFDHGFPMYTYNPDLGTEQEFIDGVAYAKSKGVHVSLYINICLHNEEYEPETIDAGAIHDENGNRVVNVFGNKDIKFDRMCPAGRPWQERMEKTAKLVTEVYGVDGIYYDMLSSNALECFNKNHNHPYDGYKDGQLQLLNNVAERFRDTHDDSLLLMGEWICDLFGGTVSYQLNQVWMANKVGGTLDVFRYTFPEFGIVEMIYPEKNMAMRCSHVAKESRKMMADVFTTGCYVWLYELEEDNTFTRDEESFAIAKELMALRTVQNAEYFDYLYVDTDGIRADDEIARVRRFENKNGKSLLAVFRMKDDEAYVTLGFEASAATVITANERVALPVENGKIKLPEAKACLIVFA